MKPLEINDTVTRLEAEILAGDANTRRALQPKLHNILSDLKSQGREIPARLRALDQALMDEAIETQFDNMPV